MQNLADGISRLMLIITPGDPCSRNTEMQGWVYRIIFIARGASAGNSHRHST